MLKMITSSFWFISTLCLFLQIHSYAIAKRFNATPYKGNTTNSLNAEKKPGRKIFKWRVRKTLVEQLFHSRFPRNCEDPSDTDIPELQTIQQKRFKASKRNAKRASGGYCDSINGLLGKRRRRRHRLRSREFTKTAYRMAVFATLAYWEFHKHPLPLSEFGIHENEFALFHRPFRRIAEWTRSLRRWICEPHVVPRFRKWMHRRDEVELNSSLWKSTHSSEKRSRQLSGTTDRTTFIFQYWMYNWVEPTSIPGLNYHDTDLLVATSKDNQILILSFAGTQSIADHVTNVQTFELANHSGFFHGGRNLTIHGSLHRGFLNAYSRVEKGSVMRLCNNCSNDDVASPLIGLHRRYSTCNQDFVQGAERKTAKTRKQDKMDTVHRENGGCRTRGEKLMTILREVVTNALHNGNAVHISGHSQGASVATMLVLDILINYPKVPVSALQLWTFGGPQVMDDVFRRAAMSLIPRLQRFLRKRSARSQFHRFVTLSDACQIDLVSNITARALPVEEQNLRGKAARKLGGLRGKAAHLSDAHYLFPIHHYHAAHDDFPNRTSNQKTKTTTTRNSLAAHATINYLYGISMESDGHPLSTDLPINLRNWLGEKTNHIKHQTGKSKQI
jgi:Lipase (class 3)